MKMLEICLRYAARLHVGSMNLRALSEIRCKATAFSRHTQYFVPQLSPFVPQLVLLSIERYICPYNNLLPYYKKRLKVTLIEFELYIAQGYAHGEIEVQNENRFDVTFNPERPFAFERNSVSVPHRIVL